MMMFNNRFNEVIKFEWLQQNQQEMINNRLKVKMVVMVSLFCLLQWVGTAQECLPFAQYVIQHNLLSESNFNLPTAQGNYLVNCDKIQLANNGSSYKLVPDNYMHLSEEDRKQKYGVSTLRMSSDPNEVIEFSAVDPENVRLSSVVLPTSYSLKDLGYISSIKNQGSCGCCWSFASTALLESYLKARGHTYGLSEEASLQCTSYYATGNRVSDCSGGYFSDSLKFLQKVGSVLRTSYPYVSGSWGSVPGHRNTTGICAQQNRIIIGTGIRQIYQNLARDDIKTLLFTEGSLMVGIYTDTNFQLYTSGVYSGCPTNVSSIINHAVLLIGYNDTDNSWLIKNSWDTTWGEAGYMRLSYTNDCGISSLLGNVKFSSYNANPQVLFTDTSLLFTGNKKDEYRQVIGLFILAILSLLL